MLSETKISSGVNRRFNEARARDHARQVALMKKVVKARHARSFSAGRPKAKLPIQGSADSAAQLHAILETAVEGIIVIDNHGTIQTFNRAAQRMFGYTADEVVGESVNMLMPNPYRDQHDAYMRNYLRTGKAKIIGIGREAVGQRKDGSIFPIDLAVSEVRDGAKVSFCGIVRDITDQKRCERRVLDVSEREQRRIGHDLHDGLCQELAGMAFLVQSMQQKVETGGAVSAAEAATVTRLLQAAVGNARRLSRGLYPVDPQPHGLRVGLAQFAIDTHDAFGVDCTFRCTQDVKVYEPESATHLFRIAQEAVRDAIRRGKASRVSIELSSMKSGVIVMSVRDNGIKVSQDGRYAEEMMLQMMRHRARLIGATLAIQSPAAGGVKVTCTMATKNQENRAQDG